MGASIRKNKKYGTRLEVDNQKAMLLTASKNFHNDLDKVRDNFIIPYHLTPSSDAYIGYLLNIHNLYDDLFSGNYTDQLLDEENRRRFKEVIITILKKYELGINFFTWVQWFILYREPLPEGIVLNERIFEQFAKDPAEMFRVPKNSEEIRMIMSQIRLFFGISPRGRIPNEYKKGYKQFYRALNKNILKTKKTPVDHTRDFEVLERQGKNLPLPGLEFEGPRVNTVENLTLALNPDNSSEEDRRLLWRMQKRQQRLKKSIRKIES